jgi:hypothetical protein
LNTKKITIILLTSLVVALLLGAGHSTAFAQTIGGGLGNLLCPPLCLKLPPPRVPEIDPNMAFSGLAMLSGGVLLIADRFRRRQR